MNMFKCKKGHITPSNGKLDCVICKGETLSFTDKDIFELITRLNRAIKSAKALRDRLRLKRWEKAHYRWAKAKGFNSYQELKDSNYHPSKFSSITKMKKRGTPKTIGQERRAKNENPFGYKMLESYEMPRF